MRIAGIECISVLSKLKIFFEKRPKKIKVTLSDKRLNSKQERIVVVDLDHSIHVSTKYIVTSYLFESISDILRKYTHIAHTKYNLYLGIQEIR